MARHKSLPEPFPSASVTILNVGSVLTTSRALQALPHMQRMVPEQSPSCGGRVMKKLLGIFFLLAAFCLPVVAQRLSPDDQQRFDSYYSRWQEYRQRSDFEQTQSMQK